MPAQVSERTEKLFSTFKIAIEAEMAAQSTYLKLKELSDDALLKQVFDGFYQDELRHEKELVKRYKELRQELGVED